MKLHDITEELAIEFVETVFEQACYAVDLFKQSDSIQIFAYLDENHLQSGFHDFEVSINHDGYVHCFRQIREIDSLSDEIVAEMVRQEFEKLSHWRHDLDEEQVKDLKLRAENRISKEIHRSKTETFKCNHFKITKFLIDNGIDV